MDTVNKDVEIHTLEHLAVIEEVNFLRGVVKAQDRDHQNALTIIDYLEGKLEEFYRQRYE